MDDYESKIRIYSKTKLLSYLLPVTSDVDIQKQTVDLIENAIYKLSLTKFLNKPFVWDHYPFRQVYKDIFLNTIYTLETTDDWSFTNLLLENRLDSEKLLSLINLSAFDKKPKLYSFTEYIEKQENQEISQGILKCGICARKGRFAYNTSYNEKQTRASDEPSTIFAQCLTCHSRWKG